MILSGNHPETLGLGAVNVNANAGNVIGFLAEVIGTAILVFTVFGAAVDGRAPAGGGARARLGWWSRRAARSGRGLGGARFCAPARK